MINGDAMEQNPAVLTRAGLFFYGVLLAISLIGSKLAEQMESWYNPAGPELVLQVGAGVAAGLLGVWISRLMERRVVAVRQLAGDFSDILRGLSRTQAWILALSSGIAEEAFFRGTLQPLIGILPATVLFAAIHIGPARRYLWWTLSALIYGIGLALLFEWGQGLVAPVTAHVVLNGINLYHLGQRPAMSRPWSRG